MTLLESLHARFVATRRARKLSLHLAAAIPPGPQLLLDVGCGNGLVSWLVHNQRPEITVRGIDLQTRDDACVPMQQYDGGCLPYESDAFDVVCLVDVLHHAESPTTLLGDAVRVAKRAVIVKDHLLEGPFAGWRLRFMDRVGNCRFGVPLPFNYWRRSEWRDAFQQLQIEPDLWLESLRLYSWPLRPFFDSSLHFIARCQFDKK